MCRLKKHKKLLIILCFFFFYTIFWWWFFNEKDIAIEEKEFYGQGIIQEIRDNESDRKKEESKKEFVEFGNFWLEINTDEVKIKAPIVNGVTSDKLAQGIGRHKTTALPSREKGNVVLSGHRWKIGNNPAYKVFENLNKLKNGDNVIIYYNGERFVYKIFERKIVGAKEVEILKQTDEPILTLYTCTPKYTSFRRLVFIGELIK